jgi:hypothetical protein
MKKELRKLTLNRETLWRLEERGLQEAVGGSVIRTVESGCGGCITDLCITAGYTGCSACHCA